LWWEANLAGEASFTDVVLLLLSLVEEVERPRLEMSVLYTDAMMVASMFMLLERLRSVGRRCWWITRGRCGWGRWVTALLAVEEREERGGGVALGVDTFTRRSGT